MMNRLTHYDSLGEVYHTAAPIDEVIQRLGDYEDTGLMPAEISGAAKWIPCSEALPEIGARVLVCRQKEKGVPYIEQAIYGVGGWWRVYGTNVKRVDFWMPLPEPPKEG